jgi:hypothetical protein
MKSAKLTLAFAVWLAVLATAGAGSAAAAFGFSSFSSSFQDPYGAPGTQLLQAGSHADLVTELSFNEKDHFLEGTVRDIEVDLPAGLSGNPQAAKQCRVEDLITSGGVCDPAAQVGLLTYSGTTSSSENFPIYNMEAPGEQTAVLAVVFATIPAKIVITPRTDGDYGLVATSANLNEGAALAHLTFTIWGVPAAPVHDAQRSKGCPYPFCGGNPAGIEPKPFLSLPTRCEPMITEARADSYQHPGAWVTASDETPPLTGCDKLDFSPTLKARPTTNVADSPSGLDLSLNLPQNADDPDGLAPANLRKVDVALPPGLVINPSGANGLGACTLQQIGFTGKGSEHQYLRYEPQLTSSIVVTLEGQSTAPIPATAGVEEATEAIEALPGLAGNVSLRKAPAGWIVSFTGSLAGSDAPGLSGTAFPNATQSLDVTGEGGSYQLQVGSASTAGTFEATFPAGATQFHVVPPSDVPRTGATLEGPGLAPDTEIAFTFQGEGFGNFTAVGLSKPTTEERTGVVLTTGFAFDAPAAEIEKLLQDSVLGAGNVFVRAAGSSGLTRSYQVIFAGDLAGTSPAITSTDTLTGPGAGVVVAKQPLAAPQPLVVTTTSEIGAAHFDRNPANCPDNSRVGSVEVDTPAFPDPLKGSVYTMTPYDNPFGTLLGIYIVVEGRGIVAKLPAKVSADPQTGRLLSTVEENPQLPIENVRLRLDGGAAAVLRTPTTCGTYATTSTMTPWSFPDTPIVKDKDEYAISQGANGGACASSEAQLPNAPAFDAGSVSAIAGTYSPFTLKLTRNDGTQQLTGIDATLPPGLLAKLAGTTYCSDAALAAATQKDGKAEQATPSCPAASRVGSVIVGAGAGPRPFYAPATAYLAGPYKGAPLSLAVVAPAVAGPFDLGTVVVRNALYVDPTTAQVHAVSDRFPSILQGIPLDVRSVDLRLDRPEFTKNPTSCDPFAIAGFAQALSGQSAPISSRFQVGECGRLKFKPKLSLKFKGKTKRTGNPALTAVLKAPPGQANIAKTTVILPKTQFIDNAHISNPCTRVQFDANACPPGSVLGHARAFTPLLDQPLEGPVYFRSNGGARELPDMVVDLGGQIPVTLVGYIDSVKVKGTESSRVRTRFTTVPDAPVSKFVLNLKGGKKGLIENSVNLCNSPQRATVQMQAHNAATKVFEQPIGTSCGKKKQKQKKRKKAGR